MMNNAQQVTAVNDAAAAAGLSSGMTLSHARALAPDVQTAPADPKGDLAVLEKLADWCCRYSPSYGVDGSAEGCLSDDHGLWIDVTGSAHLFGGEEAMLADLGHRLDQFGLRHRLGLADTPGAAWGLTRYHPTTRIVGDDVSREALFELPAVGLRLTLETLTLLRRLGLKTVGQLASIPRAALAKRFTSKAASEAVLQRLDQLFGDIDEPLTPRHPPPIYRVEQAFLDPLIEPKALAHGLAFLTSELCQMLTKANQGAERLAFLAFRVDGDVKTCHVGASLATQDPDHIIRLFEEKLGAVDPGFGIEKLALHAERTAPVEQDQGRFEGGGTATSSQNERMAQLVDRLTARLGSKAVTITTPMKSHIPEHAERQTTPGSSSKAWADMPNLSSRPSCLLIWPEPIKALAEVPDGPPLRFTWRRVTHRIVKAEGPERIAPEWASAAGSVDLMAKTRDYYRVEDDQGQRYWLFRQGLYGMTDDTGRSSKTTAASHIGWFMHGVFG